MRRMLSTAVLAALVAAGALGSSSLARSESAGGPTAPLVIFDAHIHYSRPDWSSYPPERILGILERAGITRALVSSTPDDGTLRLFAKDPARIVPMLRPYRTREDMERWFDDPTVIAYLKERLRRRVHRGIGEFHLYGAQAGTPVIKQLATLAAREDLVLQAHSDPAAIVTLFGLAPGLRVIWAHAGMSSGPREVGALMDRYRTLWADLSMRNGDVAPGGVLDPGWRALFLRHPDRFMAGTDTWITSRWEALPDSVAEVRAYLSQLPPDVALQIASKNAEALFPPR